VSWPEPVRKAAGHQLRDVQNGEFPDGAKRLRNAGPGAIQLTCRGYRVGLTIEIEPDVWVVHAFKKDAREGRETRKRHIRLIEQRVNELVARNLRRH